MFTQIKPDIRRADANDRIRLANLIHFEFYVHRHLDWREPLEWLGQQPFLLLERRGKPLGCLACPVDPPGVSWIQLFVASSGNHPEMVWDNLWPVALETLKECEIPYTIAAIPIHNWFQTMLKESGFQAAHQVVHLIWRHQTLPIVEDGKSELLLRPMNPGDVPAVAALDAATFPLLWQNSLPALQRAFSEAAIATVIEVDGQLIGYQISTGTSAGGHLARLAVHPDYQGQGVASSLLRDLIIQFDRRGAEVISVNTQSDNAPSLALYAKMGFQPTGDRHTIYEYQVDR